MERTRKKHRYGFSLFIVLLLSCAAFAQTTEIINPKGKWYFGVEAGTNRILSIPHSENHRTAQAGIMTEYYFARHWSISGRIKYFPTAVSFYSPSSYSGGWFSLGSTEYSGKFNGAVIAIPIDIKWEFRIYKNFGASMKYGFAYTSEIRSEYQEYVNIDYTRFPKQYGSFNSGFGINYFANNNLAFYVDLEHFVGASKGRIKGFIYDENYFVFNRLFSFGAKYTFSATTPK